MAESRVKCIHIYSIIGHAVCLCRGVKLYINANENGAQVHKRVAGAKTSALNVDI